MTHRVISVLTTCTLVCAPISVGAQGPDRTSHTSTVTSSTPPDRIVWMRADAWLRSQKDATQERDRRIRSQGQTARCLAGVESCRRRLTVDAQDLAGETALRVQCEAERDAATQTTLWDDAIPWLIAGGLVAAFAGGLALGVNAETK